MNKKLSIIMLLSCVGNVFSMDGDQKPLTKAERLKAMTARLQALPNVIYCSTADFADSKKGAAVAAVSCTAGGFKLLELPASQNALSTAKELLKSSKETGFAYACKAGSATCSFLSKVGSGTLSKASSISREAVDFIAQHKVGACVAGAAALGGLGYGLYKYKDGTGAAAATRRQLEEDEQAKVLSDFLTTFGGNVSSNVNSDNGIRTPLITAVELNNLPLVESLIKDGANVNLQLSKAESGHKDRDALFFAANWGRPDIVNALLAAGADNFGDALAAAKVNKNVKASGTTSAGTLEEYQAVIKAIKAAKAKAAK